MSLKKFVAGKDAASYFGQTEFKNIVEKDLAENKKAGYTSLKELVEKVRTQGKLRDLEEHLDNIIINNDNKAVVIDAMLKKAEVPQEAASKEISPEAAARKTEHRKKGKGASCGIGVKKKAKFIPFLRRNGDKKKM